MSAWSATNCFKPARTIAWSSAIRMRIMVRVFEWSCGGRPVSLRYRADRLRLVGGQAVVEGLEAHAEDLGALALVADAMVERRQQRAALDHCDGNKRKC